MERRIIDALYDSGPSCMWIRAGGCPINTGDFLFPGAAGAIFRSPWSGDSAALYPCRCPFAADDCAVGTRRRSRFTLSGGYDAHRTFMERAVIDALHAA